MENLERNDRRRRVGIVISNKMDKTIVVEVTSQEKHPLYKKFVKKTKRYKAHDEENTCGIGDTVEIMETRPLSATKRFRLVAITKKAVSNN